MANELVRLQHYISQNYSLDELNQLCLKLQVDPDELGKLQKEGVIRELLMLLSQRRQLEPLLQTLEKERSEQFSQEALSTESESVEALYQELLEPTEGPKQGSGVNIGNIYGGIRNAIIAGRDVIFPGSREEQIALRNRRDMLNLVWNTWIKGVLMKSLHNEVLIELDMETKPDAVEHPWDMLVQMPDKEPETVTSGTTMLELFEHADGSLLMLGEPGSGDVPRQLHAGSTTSFTRWRRIKRGRSSSSK